MCIPVAGTHEAEAIIREKQSVFPNSSLFLFFQGRIHRLRVGTLVMPGGYTGYAREVCWLCQGGMLVMPGMHAGYVRDTYTDYG